MYTTFKSEHLRAVGGNTRPSLENGLREVLAGEVESGGHASFGACPDCRYFREKGRDGTDGGPHLCMYFEAALVEDEITLICIAHEGR